MRRSLYTVARAVSVACLIGGASAQTGHTISCVNASGTSEECPEEDICGVGWFQMPPPFDGLASGVIPFFIPGVIVLYIVFVGFARILSRTAITAVALHRLMSKHRLFGQTVDARCLSKRIDTQTSTVADNSGYNDGGTREISHTFYYFTVRYAVQMPMPSTTGARFYRVTKEYECVSSRLYSQVTEGPMQMNHIMALTNDARSAVLQKFVDRDTPARLTAVATCKILCLLPPTVGVFGLFLVNFQLAGLPYRPSCDGFWISMVAVLILILHLLYATLRARVVAKRPP